MFFINPIRDFYGRFEAPISSASLLLGFIFDAFTLKRVDTLWENVWILGHLVIVGVFIILIHVKEKGVGDEHDPEKAHFWYVNILQFFFGGILSTYLVFYFRSSDILVTWPFIVILVLAFIANERLKSHFIKFSFQISLFFLSIYSFAIFLLPVVLHKIGATVFIFSGLISLAIITLFIWLVSYFTKYQESHKSNIGYESNKIIAMLVGGIFVLVNILYFTRLIPPIPLSLKDAGIYHSVQKDKDGNYEATFEAHDWRGYFDLYPAFTQTSMSPVYVFSAIFSPKGLNINILHEWQHFDETKNKWITESVIKLSVIGGRDGGFRTYSTRTLSTTGKWRVNVKTEQGQTIGHLRFEVISAVEEPTLQIKVIK